jgi:hypothetical protein
MWGAQAGAASRHIAMSTILPVPQDQSTPPVGRSERTYVGVRTQARVTVRRNHRHFCNSRYYKYAQNPFFTSKWLLPDQI